MFSHSAIPASQIASQENGGGFDPRYLWPHCFGGVRIIRPKVVCNENVEGSISNGQLDKKISDLESEGYTCWPPLLIPSGATEALHRRNRVFLVAYSGDKRCEEQYTAPEPERQTQGHKWNDPQHASEFWYESGNPSVSDILREADGTAEALPAKYRNAAIAAAGNAIHLDVMRAVYKAIEQVLK